ncbi:MAG: hypothetical protein NTU79_07040 [Planctomycetota bacterium]|nr:hypothetical protein [Planctomycetota bacterium]
MKFTGLILICASSCLALILPAIGVVQFPTAPRSAKQLPVSLNLPSASPQQPQALITAPASNGTGWVPATPSIMPSGQLPNAASPFPPSLQPQASAQPSPTDQVELVEKSSTSKLGMGVWLLLGPIILIGLALWTLSPNPSPVGKNEG